MKQPSGVSVFNEWDPLEEVIVGRANHAQIAKPDLGLFAIEYQDLGHKDAIPSGPYPQWIIEETEEDLAELVRSLTELGVVVRRPDVMDHSVPFATHDWFTDGQYNFCPRDLFVAVGNMLIEAPMTLRARFLETFSFRPLLLEYLRRGSRWISAPKPRLADALYQWSDPDAFVLQDLEPVFDAANILRIGRDLLYLVSNTGNYLGAQWLQSVLGEEFRVHAFDNLYQGSHIDTTITLVRPGLVVVNASRITPSNLPPLFKNWDVIYLSEVFDIGYTGIPYASEWIGMNFMMVNPQLAVVDRNQTALIKELARRNVEVIPLQMRHARTLGGGFHCVTLDVRRRGTLESHCD